uniref:hypothetical protein n=1 Tax=Pseudomonas veronii TaxID=76761 RepID=UPI003C7E9413
MANNKRIDNYSRECGRLNPRKKDLGENYLTNFSHLSGGQITLPARNHPPLRGLAGANGLALKSTAPR